MTLTNLAPLGYSLTSRRSKLAFHWRSSDLSLTPITGQDATFARTSASGLVPGSDGILVPSRVRDVPVFGAADLDADGTRERAALRLEAQRTNAFLHSESFDNAAWTKSNVTVTADATTGPDNGSTADKIVSAATTASLTIHQDQSVTSGTTYTLTVYAKKAEWRTLQIATSTGFPSRYQNFNLNAGAKGNGDVGSSGGTSEMRDIGNGWYLCRVTMAATSTTTGRFLLAILNSDPSSRLPSTTGDGSSGIYLWGAQWEAAASGSSYIATTASTVTRSADFLHWDYLPVPQALTAYVKFVDRGVSRTNSQRVFYIGPSTFGSPRLEVFNVSTLNFRLLHHNGTSSVESNVAVSAIGEVVELRCVLAADGAVKIGKSIGGGTETVATASGALALASTWGATPQFHLGANPAGSQGLGDFLDVKVALGGEYTMAQMRALF